jgi:hypothetical protein
MNLNFENVNYGAIAQLVHEHPSRFALMLNLQTVGKPDEKDGDDLCRNCLLKLGYSPFEIHLLHTCDFKLKELTHEDSPSHQRIRKIADNSLSSSNESPSYRRIASSPALIPQSSKTSAPIDMPHLKDSPISSSFEQRKGSSDSLFTASRSKESSSPQELYPFHSLRTESHLSDSLKTTETKLSLPNQTIRSQPEDHASTPITDSEQSEKFQESPSESQDDELMFKLE